MEEENKQKKSNKLIFIGILIIIIGIVVSFLPMIIGKVKDQIEESKLDEFFKQELADFQNENTLIENTILNEDNIFDVVQNEVNQIEQTINLSEEDENNLDTSGKYNMVIEVPKIGLKKGLYSINSKYNKVKYNIQVMRESDMPNKIGGNLILAGHNGDSSVSYFDDLVKLYEGDEVYIYYNHGKYIYKIDSAYKTHKDGVIKLLRDENKTTLTMITCLKNDIRRQIVYVAYLEKIENY